MELGVQGDCFDPVVAVAGPLKVELAEDRQIATLVSLFQPGEFLVRVRGRIPRHNYGRTDIPCTGHVQKCLEHPSPDNQEHSKDGLFSPVNGLMLTGGVLQAFDQSPKRIEPFTDVLRSSLLLGSEREIKLDGGSGAGKHDSGASSMRVFSIRLHSGRYRIGAGHLKPCWSSPNS